MVQPGRPNNQRDAVVLYIALPLNVLCRVSGQAPRPCSCNIHPQPCRSD